eukprot:4874870-Prymnesium_polylepis.1
MVGSKVLTLALLCVVGANALLRGTPLKARRRTTDITANLLQELFGGAKKVYDAPCVMGDESIMSQKAHGTSATPVQQKLRWSCSVDIADNICNFNRHYAERGGYWER